MNKRVLNSRFNRLFRILASAQLIALLAILISASPASAASVNVSPASGRVNTTVHITGSGFTPGEPYEIEFADGTPYEITRSGTVAGDGTISRFLTVPEMQGGTYTVSVQDDTTNSGSDSFTILPDVELNKTSAFVNELVTVSGTGFKASRIVSIRFDGWTVEKTFTNSQGNFSDSFRVPESDRGNHVVTADDDFFELYETLIVKQSISIDPTFGTTGVEIEVMGTGFRDKQSITITFDGYRVGTRPSSVETDSHGSFITFFDVPTCFNREVEVEADDGRYSASADFRVLAAISLSPSSAKVDDEVSVRGTGFKGNRLITITFDGIGIITAPRSVRTDSTGCFFAEFNIPESSSGSHGVIASDGIDTAQADFTTLADLFISPAVGRIGDQVKVEGTGFHPNRTVTVRFAGNHVGTTATDSEGSFTDVFLVPQAKSGNYNVSASDGVNTLNAVFVVTFSVTLEPMVGHVGSEVEISGTGFTGPITIRYDDSIVATAFADSDGDFSTTLKVPESVHGHHSVFVNDSVNTIEAVFTMESDSPPTPTLLQPENDSRQGSQPLFNWQSVTDLSGVTYTLQIATGPSFSNIALERSGLSKSSYTLTRTEKLEPTNGDAPYYWRVKAVDGASNESGWSEVYTFRVWVFPLWAIFVLSISAAVAVAIVISRRVWRRS